MRLIVNPEYRSLKADLEKIGREFDRSGEMWVDGKRNTIKLFEVEGRILNVKSFQVPRFPNSIVYRHFRKSKAVRSYEFANRLLQLGFLSPEPIACLEFYTPWKLKRSFYFSAQLEGVFPFMKLIHDSDFPDSVEILRQFTRFTHRLHEANIWFIDHSPGNTLIKKDATGKYEFYLVDLNRMRFKSLSFQQRMANFSRLSASDEMLRTMSEEYAQLAGKSFEEVYREMSRADQRFRDRKKRKKQWKKLFS